MKIQFLVALTLLIAGCDDGWNRKRPNPLYSGGLQNGVGGVMGFKQVMGGGIK